MLSVRFGIIFKVSLDDGFFSDFCCDRRIWEIEKGGIILSGCRFNICCCYGFGIGGDSMGFLIDTIGHCCIGYARGSTKSHAVQVVQNSTYADGLLGESCICKDTIWKEWKYDIWWWKRLECTTKRSSLITTIKKPKHHQMNLGNYWNVLDIMLMISTEIVQNINSSGYFSVFKLSLYVFAVLNRNVFT